MEQSALSVSPAGPQVPEVHAVAALPVFVGVTVEIAVPFVNVYGLPGYEITGTVMIAILSEAVEVPLAFVAVTE